MDLVKQDFWDSSYKYYENKAELSCNDPLIEWIEKTSSVCEGGQCFEIGTYPGGYSNEFGKRGHEISGIDLTPRVTELNTIFSERGYKIGDFFQGDFFKYNPINQYDIVFSVGFIEHFNDFELVIKEHAKLVKEDGVLFLAVPNFSGKFQHFMHRLLDKENLKIHNLDSMYPEKWNEILTNNGFQIIKQGYIGGFDFWMGEQKRNYFQIAIRRFFVDFLTPILKKRLPNPSPSYSPFCGIIAKKNKTQPK